MNVPIHYSKRRRSKTFLHTGSMSPVRQVSQNGWNRYREEQDRRQHFGEAKNQETETNEKGE